MQKFIIVATGTDIGKTEYLCNEIEKNIQKNQSVAALKPILSGYDENNFINSDAGRILKSLNQEINIENIHNIAPLRFVAPLAPNQAAKLENKSYNFNDIIKIVDNYIN